MTLSASDVVRAMAADVAGRYVEMAGGTAADAASLGGSLTAALRDASAGAPDGATIDVAFAPNGTGIEVTVSRGDFRSVIRQPLLAKKG